METKGIPVAKVSLDEVSVGGIEITIWEARLCSLMSFRCRKIECMPSVDMYPSVGWLP